MLYMMNLGRSRVKPFEIGSYMLHMYEDMAF
jgi:hypothetical protein